MRKHTAAACILAGAVLILDSRCAAQSVRDALELCSQVLIPSLFPLLTVSALLVPGLSGLRIPFLARLLRFPPGSEGLWLLGAMGGFPVGAAGISQAVQSGSLSKIDGARMLGLCSLCGPSFLFGVMPRFLPMGQVVAIFILQLETSLLLGAFWPGSPSGQHSSARESVSLPAAVRRAVDSMLSICAWVTLAAVAAGFLRRWLFPILPGIWGTVLTGLLELTNGIIALPEEHRFLLCALYVCFGGISVLLQIGGLASAAGLSMGPCILQKSAHGILGLCLGCLYLHAGAAAFLLPGALLFVKMTLEIPGTMVYNGRERKGSRCCLERRWSGPVCTADSARK